MKMRTICVLGGTGFVGCHLAAQLAREDYALRVLTRRRERHRDLLVLPSLQLVEADVYDQHVLNEQLSGCDAVINLVGILNEKGREGSGFHRAHVELARKIVHACQESGVRRLLHMSALNADAQKGPSHYLRTKGQAEDLVHAAAAQGLQVTSLRPSVIFGPGDSFFNRFAALLKLTPLVFPLACAGARFSPVYVGDVVQGFAVALTDRDTIGQRYDLCGPGVYTLKQLVQYTANELKLRRRVVDLGDKLSYLQARIMDHVPGKPFSLDNYQSLQVDSVCQHGFPAIFGIVPTALETVVPSYLAQHSLRARYQDYRRQARRG
jgi:nucleoside-diphosphate-sugar epimerase